MSEPQLATCNANEEMRAKFMALYRALEVARDDLRHLVNDTNSEPSFGEHEAITRAESALFANRPRAEWEVP